MFYKLKAILIASVFCAAVSSCVSKEKTFAVFPPVDDLKPTSEPSYPVEALTSEDIERAWWNEILLWGRSEHDKIVRICKWSQGNGLELPKDYCK